LSCLLKTQQVDEEKGGAYHKFLSSYDYVTMSNFVAIGIIH